MPRLVFTSHLRHVAPGPAIVPGATVREALNAAFLTRPALAAYVLDDQKRLRRHVVLFVDGYRAALDDRVDGAAEICVLQALSGG